MKSIVFATLALVCALVFTSQATAQAAGAQGGGGGAPKEHSMTGCLTKGTAPGSYLVTNVDRVQSIGIVSSAADLAPHVGHKIEVTGVGVPKAEAEADPNVPKAPHYMKLSGVKMLSATCP